SGSIDRLFGDGVDLEEPTGRAFLARYHALFAQGIETGGMALVINDEASRPMTDPAARMLTFELHKDDIPVIGAGVSLGVRDGRVVLIATQALAPVTTSSKPRIDSNEALDSVVSWVGQPGLALEQQKDPSLAFYPRLEPVGAAQVLRHHL